MHGDLPNSLHLGLIKTKESGQNMNQKILPCPGREFFWAMNWRLNLMWQNNLVAVNVLLHLIKCSKHLFFDFLAKHIHTITPMLNWNIIDWISLFYQGNKQG